MTPRRRSLAEVLILLAGIALLVFLLVRWIGAEQTQKENQIIQRRDDGIAAFAAGNNSTAATDLSVYLTDHPNDVVAWEDYAKALTLTPGNNSFRLLDADRVIRRILSVAPQRYDDWRVLMHLDFVLARWHQTVDEADQLLAVRPEDQDALALKSVALEQLGQSEASLHSIQQLPPQRQLQIALALSNQGDVKQAIGILSPLVASEGANAPEVEVLALASMYCRQRDFGPAEDLCDGLMKHLDPPAVILASELAMFRGNTSAAEALLSGLPAMRNWPPGELDQMLGGFYFEFGEYDSALRHFQAAAIAAPQMARNWLSLIECQFAMGHGNDAIQTLLSQALPHVPNDPKLKALAGQIEVLRRADDFESGRSLAAAMVLDPQLDALPARTLRELEQLTDTFDPGAGDNLAPLRKLAAQSPQFLPARCALIDAEMRTGHLQEAVDESEKAIAAFGNDVVPYRIATEVMTKAGLWSDALPMARIWRQRTYGDALDVDLALAQLQIRAGDTDEAVAVVQHYLNDPDLKSADRWQILMVQANALISEGKTSDAAALLWPMAASVPSVRQDWMDFIVSTLPPEKAADELNRMESLVESETNGPIWQTALSRAWDSLARRWNDPHFARIARQQIAASEQIPSIASQAYFWDGVFHEEDYDAPGAQAAYRHSTLPQAMNNLALLLAKHGGDLDSARQLANQCIQMAPNVATYWDTLAQLHDQAGEFHIACDDMHHAVRLEPDNAEWRVHLADSLIQDGQWEAAGRVISDLDTMTPGPASLTAEEQNQLVSVRKKLADAGGLATR